MADGVVSSVRLTPYYRSLPKERVANLEARVELWRAGSSSRSVAKELRIACARDPLFWLNAFVWAHDPLRQPDDPLRPVITYAYQDDAFMEIYESIGKYDLAIEKSRDMLATWMVLLAFLHRFEFKDYQTFLVASRKEDYVDKRDNPDALFWKLDHALKKQPTWLRPTPDAMTRTDMHLGNGETGSTIDGESTTGNIGVGGRRTAVFLDEFALMPNGHEVLAATADITKSRIFTSTPRGTGNAFYDVTHMGKTRKLTLHWSLHPQKNEGLTTDPDTGKLRSPWYDAECARRNHPMEVAQELDLNYLGSDYQFFDDGVLDQVQKRDCREPAWSGEVEYDAEALRITGWSPKKKGRLRLWFDPENSAEKNWGIPDGEYVIGGDIAAGTGSSNSALSIVNRTTHEKVGEWSNAHVDPNELAKIAVTLARVFNRTDSEEEGALLIWESNNHGRIFGGDVIKAGYRNVYYRTEENSLGKRSSDFPGWVTTHESKLGVLGEYRKAWSAGEIIVRSMESVAEARQYVFTTGGSVEHSRAAHTGDPSGARANHGDMVIADALACWMLRTPVAERVQPEPAEEQDTFFSRQQQFKRSERFRLDQEDW